MSIQLFEILFDDAEVNPRAVYRPGQLVSYKVHLILREAIKCQAIFVKHFGNSKVNWSESWNTSSGSRQRYFSSEEVYMDQTEGIYTSETSGPMAEHHPPGEFYYPGSFQVPNEAPSSYEGGTGRIRYSVNATIGHPSVANKWTVKFFTVIRDLDLNCKPLDLVGSFKIEGPLDVNCCLCFGCCFGTVQIVFFLPKRGYVPGEQVHVTGQIANTSNASLNSIKMEIYQKSYVHAQGFSSVSSRVVSSVRVPRVPIRGSIKLDCLIPVNPVPSSHIEGCKNIEVFYYLRVNGDDEYCVSLTRECCELFIGTIPMRSPSGQPLGVPSLPGDSTQSVMEPISSQPQLQQLPPPPSYEECMFGRVAMDEGEGEKISGSTQWAPSYPVYAMASAAPPLPADEVQFSEADPLKHEMQ